MFDPIHEDGLLRRDEIDSLRFYLEDIVDRLYQNDTPIDCDELSNSIEKMARILGVNTPNVPLHVKLGPPFYEYIEDKFMQYEDMNRIYRYYRNPHKAISRLMLTVSIEKLDISKDSIREFCTSDFYKKKVEEANVL